MIERALGWDRLIVLFALAVGVVLAYWPSAVALSGFWTDVADETYTHGYPVLFISIWLVVRDRKRLAAAPLAPEARALWVLVGLSLAWVYFFGAAIQDPQLLLLPLLLLAAIIATLGRALARVIYFPIGFIFFAMPAWSDIGRPLQWLSIQANDFLLWAWGIPAYVTGKYVHLPGGTLKIAEGCGGLHFFMVGLALAALYGELARDSRRRRMAWLALMGVFAIVANWLRIFVVVAAAYETDMQTYLVTVSHYWFGWGVFVAFFFGFLWLAGVLANRWDRRENVDLTAERKVENVGGSPPPTPVQLKFAVAALAILGALPSLVYAMSLLHPIARQGVAIEWPAAPSGWQGPRSVDHASWSPSYRNATAQSFRRYVTRTGESVEIFAVAYRRQTQAGKLLWWWNSLLGAHGGLTAVSGSRTVAGASGHWRQELVVNEAHERSLIWSRYTIGGIHFVDPRISQLWYGIAAFTTRPVSSLTALRAQCTPNCAAARARLDRATAKLLPSVHAETYHD